MNKYLGDYFEWMCPYIDRPCDSFECSTCEIEKQEYEIMDFTEKENK